MALRRMPKSVKEPHITRTRLRETRPSLEYLHLLRPANVAPSGNHCGPHGAIYYHKAIYIYILFFKRSICYLIKQTGGTTVDLQPIRTREPRQNVGGRRRPLASDAPPLRSNAKRQRARTAQSSLMSKRSHAPKPALTWPSQPALTCSSKGCRNTFS